MRSAIRIAAVLLAAAMLCTTSSAKERDWKKGTLSNVDVGNDAVTAGKHGKIKTKQLRIFTYRVDSEEKVYEGQEIRSAKTPGISGLEVNGDVFYDVDKGHLYLRDSEGKAHKLDLLKTTRKRR